MADIKILAKQTHQVAMGEKYGAGAMGAHQGGLFTEMGVVAGDPCLRCRVTYAGFTAKPVNAAFTRAKGAGA